MKIKLTQPGWEGYTGQMGVLFFENGTSTADVAPKDAVRMAATMLCEYEDGTSCSPSQRLLDTTNQEATSVRETTDDETPAGKLVDVEAPVEVVLQPESKTRDDGNIIQAGTNDGVVELKDEDDGEEEAAATNAVDSQPAYTNAELEAIADSKGISGLREIAEPHGVKSTSIKGLIDSILAAGIKKGA